MDCIVYFIIAAVVFVIASAITLIHTKRHKGPNVIYDTDLVIVVFVVVLVLSVGWVVAVPAFIIALSIYYVGVKITKWLNK